LSLGQLYRDRADCFISLGGRNPGSIRPPYWFLPFALTGDLLAAYLDRRHPRWREDAERDAAAGSSPARSGKMTKEEAYQILGLEPGASAEQIGRAHRGLMKKLHPDQGGSTYLAARVNEAKDVLLRRNR
jgi:hypothetical protein